MPLNSSQQTAFEKLQEFIIGTETFFSLEGGGGFGKTYLLNELEQALIDFNKIQAIFNSKPLGKLHYTATTNKAATLLNKDGKTVYKYLQATPFKNYETGELNYKYSHDMNSLNNDIVLIDEASMLGHSPANRLAAIATHPAKVIFISDPFQFAPVGSNVSLVEQFKNELKIGSVELTEPVRQDADSHLYQICHRMREAVRHQIYAPILQGKGIRFVDAKTFKGEILESFKANLDTRVISYENAQAENYNSYIRKKLYGTHFFRVGDPVVVANAYSHGKKGLNLPVETQLTISEISDPIHEGTLAHCNVKFSVGTAVYKIPVDKPTYLNELKKATLRGKKHGDWSPYYRLKEEYLDIRDAFSCTGHKAQGSTYDKVFIDFNNLTQIQDLNTFLRAVYVAISRARFEVVIYGL